AAATPTTPARRLQSHSRSRTRTASSWTGGPAASSGLASACEGGHSTHPDGRCRPDQEAALEVMRYLGFTRNVEYCKFNRTVYPAAKAAAKDPYFAGDIWKAMWTNWNETKVPPHVTGVPVQDADNALNSILTDIVRKQRNSREGL